MGIFSFVGKAIGSLTGKNTRKAQTAENKNTENLAIETARLDYTKERTDANIVFGAQASPGETLLRRAAKKKNTDDYRPDSRLEPIKETNPDAPFQGFLSRSSLLRHLTGT